MKTTLSIVLFLLTLILSAIAQTLQDLNNLDSAIICLSEKSEGFGPEGNMTVEFGSIDGIDSLELLAYPKMKNIPDSLGNLKQFCYMLNPFQFYYQNYRNSVYSKNYLLFRHFKYTDFQILLKDPLPFFMPLKLDFYYLRNLNL